METDVNASDSGKQTSLHLAAGKGHGATIRLLLDRGADVNAKNSAEETPLHRAAGEGHEPTVRLLPDRGAEMGAKDSVADTPLHLPACRGHETSVRLLLDRGDEINATDFSGNTLHGLAVDGHESTVRLHFPAVIQDYSYFVLMSALSVRRPCDQRNPHRWSAAITSDTVEGECRCISPQRPGLSTAADADTYVPYLHAAQHMSVFA